MPIEITTAESICRIRLADPARKNPLTEDLLRALLAALDDAVAGGAKVAIVHGAGDAFSAGYGIAPEGRVDHVASHDIAGDIARLRRLAEPLLAIRRHRLPTIAQVHGYCLAGGTDLMLMSDIAVAADTARIGLPNVRSLGISLTAPLWPLLVNPGRAKLMAFTGDWISGAEAERWGLIAMAVPETELAERVDMVARRIAMLPAALLATVKATTNKAWDAIGVEQMIASAVELDAICHFSAPVVEFWQRVQENGLTAAIRERDAPFAEGRPF